jgi:hypothetical protein
VKYDALEESTRHYTAWGITPQNSPEEYLATLARQASEGFFGKRFLDKPLDEQKKIMFPYKVIHAIQESRWGK